jgi:hypothetical protein
MNFRTVLTCVVVSCFAGGPIIADTLRPPSFSDLEPSYTKIANKCGTDGGSSFSAAEYAKAKADATKALNKAIKDGKRQNTRILQEKIKADVARVKKCEEEEAAKNKVPDIFSCHALIPQYQQAAYPLTSGRAGKADTTKALADVQKKFRAAFKKCLPKALKTCFDPTNTDAVDELISLLEMGRELGLYKDTPFNPVKSNSVRIEVPLQEGSLFLDFCTDTDFKCRGIDWRCEGRTEQLGKLIFSKYY